MFQNKTFKLVLGILFFGSLWGLSEASFGEWLYSRDIPNSSIYLAVIAIFIIAAAHVSLKHRLTGTMIGLIAMLFKMINIPLYTCHLLAIGLVGVGYDMSSWLVSYVYSGKFRLPVIGLLSTYTGRALFAFTITYVWRYSYWTAVGLPRVIDYIFVSGSVAALLSLIAVPVGHRLGERSRDLSWTKLHPRFAASAVFAATLGIWIIQKTI